MFNGRRQEPEKAEIAAVRATGAERRRGEHHNFLYQGPADAEFEGQGFPRAGDREFVHRVWAEPGLRRRVGSPLATQQRQHGVDFVKELLALQRAGTPLASPAADTAGTVSPGGALL